MKSKGGTARAMARVMARAMARAMGHMNTRRSFNDSRRRKKEIVHI